MDVPCQAHGKWIIKSKSPFSYVFRYEERVKLEELLFTISLLTKELRAKPYAPTESDLKLATISGAWEGLERAEHAYESALRDAYLRWVDVWNVCPVDFFTHF